MRKNIILLVMFTVVPYLLCLLMSLIFQEIEIGKGDGSIQHNLLNKTILIETEGLYRNIDVEEYLLGVLPGTIPADYQEITLQIQAIMIRTNVLKEMEEKKTCDAADLSYTYLTLEERKQLFGQRNFQRYEKRFEKAVVDTAGQVLRQEGSLIMAMYHEVNIGKTVSAKELLGEEIAYLQSVDSSQDVEAKNYMQVIQYTWKELEDLLEQPQEESTQAEQITADAAQGEPAQGEQMPTDAAQETPASKDDTGKKETPSGEETAKHTTIQIEEATEQGYVKKVSVNGVVMTGEEAMELFKLPSVHFYVEEQQEGLRIICLGKGMGMGVSQYGANRMAMNGKGVKQILKHYYKKVSLEDY